MTRRRGAPPHERACRLGAGCRCARPPPGSPLRSDPAPRGAGGDLDPVSAHRRGAITGSRPRPATQLARHDHDENRPGRLHLSKARFWSERWGPPQIGRWASPRSHVVIVHALLATVSSAESVGPHVGAYPTAQASLRGMTLPSRFAALVRSSETAPAPPTSAYTISSLTTTVYEARSFDSVRGCGSVPNSHNNAQETRSRS